MKEFSLIPIKKIARVAINLIS